jgi:hypothetical protein
MLELFSRKPDSIPVAEGAHLAPIPVDEEVASLSAILLDDGYYGWIHAGRREVEGVPVVGPEHLIPLKAKAWLNLRACRGAGEQVDRRQISKHRNDIFRLYQVIQPEALAAVPECVRSDMEDFINRVPEEQVDLKRLGLRSVALGNVRDGLRAVYGVG